MEVNLNKENFEQEVLKSDKTVLVDFWATWCGPCQMIAPVVEDIAKQGNVKVGKVNVDDNQELAIEYGVMSIPTLIVFENGRAVNRMMGARPKDVILEML